MSSEMKKEYDYLRRLNHEAGMGRVEWLKDFTQKLMNSLVEFCAAERPLKKKGDTE